MHSPVKRVVFVLAAINVLTGCAGASVLQMAHVSRTPLSNNPTPAEIVAAANEAQVFLASTIQSAQRRADKLGHTILWGQVVSKTGQYVGGAGAFAFGLNDQGRNAGYAGGAAALFTAIEQLWKTDDKSARRAACLELANMRVELDKVIGAWKLQANDAGFQMHFVTERDEFYDRVDARFRKCNGSVAAR